MGNFSPTELRVLILTLNRVTRSPGQGQGQVFPSGALDQDGSWDFA